LSASLQREGTYSNCFRGRRLPGKLDTYGMTARIPLGSGQQCVLSRPDPAAESTPTLYETTLELPVALPTRHEKG
jgi:hypothetical protein